VTGTKAGERSEGEDFLRDPVRDVPHIRAPCGFVHLIESLDLRRERGAGHKKKFGSKR